VHYFSSHFCALGVASSSRLQAQQGCEDGKYEDNGAAEDGKSYLLHSQCSHFVSDGSCRKETKSLRILFNRVNKLKPGLGRYMQGIRRLTSQSYNTCCQSALANSISNHHCPPRVSLFPKLDAFRHALEALVLLGNSHQYGNVKTIRSYPLAVGSTLGLTSSQTFRNQWPPPKLDLPQSAIINVSQ
jgi:hypothetical protein